VIKRSKLIIVLIIGIILIISVTPLIVIDEHIRFSFMCMIDDNRFALWWLQLENLLC